MNIKDLKLRTVHAYKLMVKVAGRWMMVGLTYATDLFGAWERIRARYGLREECRDLVPVPVEG